MIPLHKEYFYVHCFIFWFVKSKSSFNSKSVNSLKLIRVVTLFLRNESS
eukprot:UN25975